MKYLLSLFLFIEISGNAQDQPSFNDEVDTLIKKYDTLWDPSKETVVFTGSSSIRIWSDLKNRFPGHQIVNTGFGGSQASHLLAYSKELILRFDPMQVFIYEGDNDISAGKKPREIIATTKKIIQTIQHNHPNTEIVLISAKPSIARWKLKRIYKRLNRKFRRLAKKDPFIDYADVWTPMLYKRKVKADIFNDDGLHMNPKGYKLWYDVIKRYIRVP